MHFLQIHTKFMIYYISAISQAMQCHRVQYLLNYELEQMKNEAVMAQLHILS